MVLNPRLERGNSKMSFPAHCCYTKGLTGPPTKEMDDKNYTVCPHSHAELSYTFIPKDLSSGALPDRIENIFHTMCDLLGTVSSDTVRCVKGIIGTI